MASLLRIVRSFPWAPAAVCVLLGMGVAVISRRSKGALPHDVQKLLQDADAHRKNVENARPGTAISGETDNFADENASASLLLERASDRLRENGSSPALVAMVELQLGEAREAAGDMRGAAASYATAEALCAEAARAGNGAAGKSLKLQHARLAAAARHAEAVATFDAAAGSRLRRRAQATALEGSRVTLQRAFGVRVQPAAMAAASAPPPALLLPRAAFSPEEQTLLLAAAGANFNAAHAEVEAREGARKIAVKPEDAAVTLSSAFLAVVFAAAAVGSGAPPPLPHSASAWHTLPISPSSQPMTIHLPLGLPVGLQAGGAGRSDPGTVSRDCTLDIGVMARVVAAAAAIADRGVGGDGSGGGDMGASDEPRALLRAATKLYDVSLGQLHLAHGVEVAWEAADTGDV